jgi:hypothetical protein
VEDGLPATAHDAAVSAVRAGSVLTICWDHRAVGLPIRVPVVPSSALAMNVHVGDRYEFTTLSAAARTWPAETSAALASALDEEAKPVRRLERALTHPRFYASLLALTGREVLRRKGLRWAAMAYARDRNARHEISMQQLAHDFLRASVLLEAVRSKRLRLGVTVDQGTLRVQSVPGTLEEAPVANIVDCDIGRVVWDHSRIGTTIDAPPNGVRRPPITLGTHGVYEFDALSRLARSRPGRGGNAFLESLQVALAAD